MNFGQLASKLTPKGWAMVGGAAAVSIVFLVLIFNFASKPSYSTLITGLDPTQTGKITSTLSTKGIGYQIQNNGTALAVQSDKTGAARIALASAGLLSGTQQPGFELFDKQQLGASNFQQQITYQRALEGQLDQTIETIQGVSSAQVQLVLPDPQAQLFADNSQSSSAAVLLSDSGTLDPSSVRGIAQLVASSVPGLQSNKVTITDSSGQPLWPNGDSAGGDGTALSAQSADQKYDSMTAASVGAMLTQTLGAGKAEVQVNANVDANQATSDTLVYGKKGVALQSQTQNETLTGGNGSGGVAGTAGNIGTTAQTAGAGSSGSNYKNKTDNTTFGVNKTVTHSVVAPGTVKNQTVSVLVDKSVPAASIPGIKSAVAGAVGLNAKRGDTISVSQIAFAKPTTATPAAPNKMIGYAKYGIIGLGALIFLFLMTRMVKRRENESFGQPTWLRELETPRSLAALSGGDATEVHALRAPANMPKRQVEELVERDPDRVAQQVRAWMSED
jgi:flagellar M-ring protein FliF